VHNLLLTCSGIPKEAFFFLFQSGVRVPVTSGTTMADFLLCSLEIPSEYLQERVQTIFLDGRPVDDLTVSVVGPGSVVALSASLPGLAGATMRKGGTYACFRSSISHRESSGAERGGETGYATVKLFNLLMGELGPTLLQRGIVVPASVLLHLFRSGDVLGQCERIAADGLPLDDHSLLLSRLAAQQEEPVVLCLTTTDEQKRNSGDGTCRT
jgi:hypothetical protein